MMRKFFLFLCLTLQVASAFFLQTLKARQLRRQVPPTLYESNIQDEAFPDDSLVDEVLLVAIEASKAAASIIRMNSDGSAVVEKKSTSRDLLSKI
jgi:hypothetical protein